MNQFIKNPFILDPDIKTEDAFACASEFLASAAAIVYESADNSTAEYRPLARSALHQIAAAQLVIEAMALRFGQSTVP
ncbi:hypothetical protein M2401_006839 [Pseudomonas sp. JUb42]|uniref:DUF6124 family protein n=1 Tax=Pseudomonas sp. JUb42 TaxID=2940611 RepID=UPI002167BC38|nr:hypothetical protein [Pseudomonas sp. JUb42]MCS3473071.1 hypothetical protein [Pseudomonas sp. JUb42]